MPIYEYQCDDCEEVHEELHSMKDNPEVKCESCGGTCERLIGKVNIRGTASSKSVNYKMHEGLSKAGDERKHAARHGHMGSDPYGDMDKPGAIPNVDIVDSLSDI